MAQEEVKYFEIRDRGTFIPAMAVRFIASVRDPDYPLRRAGFGVGNFHVLLTNLVTGRTCYDCFEWEGITMPAAHATIEEHWSDYASGDVVDSEFLRDESSEPKLSERLMAPC